VRTNPPSRFLAEVPPALVEGRVRPARAPAFSRPNFSAPPKLEPLPRAEPRGPRVDYGDTQLPPGEIPPLSPGMRVEHPVFGAGTLVELHGAGPSAKVRVRFDHAGLKTMALRYAQLRFGS